MKKMTKTYEAPVAEVFEMQMPATLLGVSGGDFEGGDGEGENPLIIGG